MTQAGLPYQGQMDRTLDAVGRMLTGPSAGALLQSLERQIERVRNNGARRRGRKALAKAKGKRALTLEIERMCAENARTLTVGA